MTNTERILYHLSHHYNIVHEDNVKGNIAESEAEIVVAFEYKLPKFPIHNNSNRVDGYVVITKDQIIAYEGGAIRYTYPLSAVNKFTCTAGVGTATLDIVTEEGDFCIARSTQAQLKEFSALSKRLNGYLEDVPFNRDFEDLIVSCCPKCGRPYQYPSRTCYSCQNKGEYIKRLWKIASPNMFLIGFAVVTFFLVTGLNLIIPLIQRTLVNGFIYPPTLDPGESATVIKFLWFNIDVPPTGMPASWKFAIVLISIVVTSIVIRLLSAMRDLALVKCGTKVIAKLREAVFDKIQRLSVARISERTTGSLMYRVTDDVNQIQGFITGTLPNAIEQLLTLVAMIFMLLYLADWQLTLFIFLPVPFILVAWRMFHVYMGRLWNRSWIRRTEADTTLHDIFQGIRVVKSYGRERGEIDRYGKKVTEHRDTQIVNERMWAIISPTISFFMGIGEFFLLYYVGDQVLKHGMNPADIAMFSSYVAIVYNPLRWLQNLPRMIINVSNSIVKVFDIIDDKSDVEDSKTAVDLDIKGDIKLDNVSFGYDTGKEVIHHVNLEIHSGEMVGIVGRSGSGKTTLINLIMRLYEVAAGSVTIDGVDVRDISQRALRSQIGVVLQETFLFSGTIYKNLTYAKPDATFEEVIRAAVLSGAHKFISKLPDGYETKVGERGYTLSGGERQRISIARALLHDPKILILDEATASLDTETEKQIQEAIQKLTVGRTTIAIAHRLSTLRNADRLVVLERGRVAEVGTHEELVEYGGIYAGLVRAQRQMSKMAGNAGGTKNAQSEAKI